MLDVLNGRLRVETLILFSVCLGKQSHAHTHQYLLRLALPGPHEHSLNSLSVVYQISCAAQEVMPRRPHSFIGMIHHFLNCITVSSVVFLFLIAEARVITFFLLCFTGCFLWTFLFHLSHSEFFISIFWLVPNIFLIYIFRYGTLVICFLISPTSENAFLPLLHMNYLCQVCSTGVTIILAAVLHCLLKLKSFKGV